MVYINSNLTNREAYALHGKLDDARMQELLDIEDQHETLEIERDEAQGDYENMRFLIAQVADDLEAVNLKDEFVTKAIIKKAINDLKNY